MKPTTYLATVSELNEELSKQRAINLELLDALEDAVRYAQGGDVLSPKALERARNAIAKASQ